MADGTWEPGRPDGHPFKETPVQWGSYTTNKYHYVVAVFDRMVNMSKRRISVVGYRPKGTTDALRPSYSEQGDAAREKLGIAAISATDTECQWYLRLAPRTCNTIGDYERLRARRAQIELQRQIGEQEATDDSAYVTFI